MKRVPVLLRSRTGFLATADTPLDSIERGTEKWDRSPISDFALALERVINVSSPIGRGVELDSSLEPAIIDIGHESHAVEDGKGWWDPDFRAMIAKGRGTFHFSTEQRRWVAGSPEFIDHFRVVEWLCSAASETRPPAGESIVVGDVLGVRSWKVRDFGQLQGTYGAIWTAPELEAQCSSRHHPAPDLKCRCGIYAVTAPTNSPSMFEAYVSDPMLVDGLVRLSGRVVVGDRGYRASKAEVVLLVIDPQASDFLVGAPWHDVPTVTRQEAIELASAGIGPVEFLERWALGM